VAEELAGKPANEPADMRRNGADRLLDWLLTVWAVLAAVLFAVMPFLAELIGVEAAAGVESAGRVVYSVVFAFCLITGAVRGLRWARRAECKH